MSDEYPRRNLGAGEVWGREVERRQRNTEARIFVQDGGSRGSSRDVTNTSADLSRRIQSLKDLLAAVPYSVAVGQTATSFTLDDTWRTAATITVTKPDNKTNFTGIAYAVATVAENRTGSGSAQFQWPFSPEYVTSEYGPRIDPVTGESSFHNGIDFAYAGIGGTPIIAPGSGTVAFTGFQVERGNWIELNHPGGLATRYYHLQSPSPLSVGDPVVKNSTVLGLVGTTGSSTGNHLHWETLIDGDRVNPREFMAIYGSDAPASVGSLECRVLFNGVSSGTFTADTRARAPGATDYSVHQFTGSGGGAVVTPVAELQLRSTRGSVSGPFRNASISLSGYFV